MRLAWFTPMPASRESAAAAPVTAVLPLVAREHEIDVYTSSAGSAEAWRDWIAPVRHAVDFLWRAGQRPYDLHVYHLGHTRAHDFVWGYLWNYPGLVVLEDRHLHAARARILLDRLEPRLDHYGLELGFNHRLDPDLSRALALFTGPALRAWPMRRAVVAGARLVAVHSEELAEELEEECPGAAVQVVPPAAADPGAHADLRRTSEAAGIRRRLELTSEELLVTVIGPAAHDSRLAGMLDSAARLRAAGHRIRLLLADVTPEDEGVVVEAAGKAGAIAHVRAVTDRELDGCLGAADIALGLAWPPSARLNALCLRGLASGVPAIVTDQTDYSGLPLLDPRVDHGAGVEPAATSREPAAMLIDLLEEQQTLRMAMTRLAADPDLRAQLGRAARAFCLAHHTPQHAAEAYLRAIDRAAAARSPERPLPGHLRPDVFAHARALVESVGGRLPDDVRGRTPRTP